MNGLPDALFIIDINHEKIAVQEAKKVNIKTIGIIDTNTDPDIINYKIPGNDDAMRAIKLYCKIISDYIIKIKKG